MKNLAFIKRSNGQHWVGDGFPVRNIFSYHDVAEELSPFLLLDYAGPAHFPPTERRLGVGAHPHRGFETVTIVYQGGVSHRDSAGGGGTIGPGDVQWMTAASGVLHEEFHSPEFAREGGEFEVVQLWVNLPAKKKLSQPGYQALAAGDIPQIELPRGAGIARLIAGEWGSTRGPARTVTPMNVWDLRLLGGRQHRFNLPAGHTAALFVLEGALQIGTQSVVDAELAVFERQGTQVVFETARDSRVLLLSGRPIAEPIVGHGPFVMNSREEITQAMRDFGSGKYGVLS